jgi:hypothetical protein
VAVRVQSVAAAVPPLSLMTVLTSLRCAVWSSLTIKQIAEPPLGTVTLAPADVVCAWVASMTVQDHSPEP